MLGRSVKPFLNFSEKLKRGVQGDNVVSCCITAWLRPLPGVAAQTREVEGEVRDF